MKSPYKGKTGLRRLVNAFGYSIAGTLAAFKHEDAFRQEVVLAVVLTPVALYFGETAIHQALMISSLLFIIKFNLINLLFCKKIVIFVCKNLLCIRFSSQQIPLIKLMVFLQPIEIFLNIHVKKLT